MHIISREQGRAILMAVVIVAVLGILFAGIHMNGKTGILDIGGSVADTDDMAFDAGIYTDTGKITDYGKRIRPEVTYHEAGEGRIQKGQSICLLDYFNVRIADGQKVTGYSDREYSASETLQGDFTDFKLEILEIADYQGNSLLNKYRKDDGMMSFAQRGIYTVSFEVIDGDFKYSNLSVRLPVE